MERLPKQTLHAAAIYVVNELNAFRPADHILYPPTTLLQIENTHNRAGGVVVDQREIERVCASARESGVATFLDGARLWNAAVASGSDLSELAAATSDAKSEGKGGIDREEKITTRMAAVVTQVLPNGNMVIEGRQEIRLNFEMRELIVAGVVRPEDITSDNTIPISKIAPV